MIAIGVSDVGIVRDSNQDSYFVSKDEKFPLLIVADGMGGHKAGEVASAMAVESAKTVFMENKDKLVDEKSIKEILKESIKYANNEIYKKSLANEEYRGMGTTMIILYVYENIVYIAQVGDSRVYMFNGSLKQVTDDHSLVNELVKEGEITKEEAREHPKKNIITRAVGTKIQVEPDIYTYAFEKGQKVLMCTDGLTDMIRDEEIDEILKRDKGNKELCFDLIEAANKKGGRDNITTIIVEL